MSFGLIVLYLPMSTMAVHAIIWTSVNLFSLMFDRR